MATAPEKDQDSKIGDLLGHYSSRAVAQASLFIACIFGIVTLSALIHELDENWLLVLSMVLFLGFSYFGHYTLIRFGYYADLAQQLADKGLNLHKILETVGLQEHFEKKEEEQGHYLFLRNILDWRHGFGSLILSIVYWIGVFLLGLVAYEKFLEFPYTVWFGFSYTLTLLAVSIPVIYTRASTRLSSLRNRKANVETKKT